MAFWFHRKVKIGNYPGFVLSGQNEPWLFFYIANWNKILNCMAIMKVNWRLLQFFDKMPDSGQDIA